MDYSSPAPAAQPATAPDLTGEVRTLRLAVGVMLVALVILAASLGVYLFRQVAMLRRQSEAAGNAATQAYQHYKQNIEGPAVQFEKNLQEFARTNADLQLRIAKFFPSGAQTPPPVPQANGAPAPR